MRCIKSPKLGLFKDNKSNYTSKDENFGEKFPAAAIFENGRQTTGTHFLHRIWNIKDLKNCRPEFDQAWYIYSAQ